MSIKMTTQLDDIQLFIVDLQENIIGQSITNAPETLIEAATALAKAAATLSWPIHYTIVPNEDAVQTIPSSLKPWLRNDNIFARSVTDPFLVNNIKETLAKQSRKTLILTGFSTEVAILQTAFAALDNGYKLYIPVDAIGSRSERTERAALNEMEKAGAIITSTRSLLLRLTPDLANHPGCDVIKLLKNL